ncbi:hypothetical protein CANCADRAFT_4395 [Tortispora caseinolytica NRRL Y-17796]|uniref:Uncharacterized protein n=1 Tax=Tortispora caseinolytica NRRL Y-17796 TaxID=767744 RepID=A0A1E4TDE9_9ASCO|nr:hypothetical protein CANCADRAFT_4395 [Tortispora caseinolytica NRRL Y-17796]
MPLNFEVKGKTALVTGGSRGLGLYAVQGLLKGGAKTVYITARKASQCKETEDELNKLGLGKVVALPGDITNRDRLKEIIEEIGRRENGKLDIVIANAGATWGAPFDEHPDEAIQKVLHLNVRSVFATVQLAAPLLEKAGTPTDPSRVITVGSVAGFLPHSESGTFGYLASKAAVHHLTKSLSATLGPRNITVNAIAPGFFPSKMANGLLEKLGKEDMMKNNPRQRLGEPEDIEGLILFLCSPAASYINGAIIVIDGGARNASKAKF